MKYLVLEAHDTDQTQTSEVNRFAVELGLVPIDELIAQAANIRPIFDDKTRVLKSGCMQFDWHEGEWLASASIEELDGPMIAEDSTEDGNYSWGKLEVAGGHILLWWEGDTATIEFRAYLECGIEYFSGAVSLDWLVEQVAA